MSLQRRPVEGAEGSPSWMKCVECWLKQCWQARGCGGDKDARNVVGEEVVEERKWEIKKGINITSSYMDHHNRK